MGCYLMVRNKIKNILGTIILFVLILGILSNPAAAGGEEKDQLLNEVQEYIENYYLYYDDHKGTFPPGSLKDVEQLLDDPYSTYLQHEELERFQEDLGRSFEGVGLILEMKGSSTIVLSTVDGSPAEEAGLKSGDVVISVDDEWVWGTHMEQVKEKIRGEKGTEVIITVLRDGIFIDFSLVREKISYPSVDYNWVDTGVAMLKAYNFDSGTAGEITEILKELEREGLKGVILDLRDNQGGYVDEVLQTAALFTDGVLLQMREKSRSWEEIRSDEQPSFDFPMTVIVNQGTASAAEILAAALKDHQVATLVGEETFGKGTMQAVFNMDHGGYLKLTTAEFLSPAGHDIENSGVAPHFLQETVEEKQDLALKLLQHAITRRTGGQSFIEASLGEMHEEDRKTPLTFEEEGQTYYPLRSSLLISGRLIYTEESSSLYYFDWDDNRYFIDTEKRVITAGSDQEGENEWDFILDSGVSYVPAEFLSEVLGIPFY